MAWRQVSLAALLPVLLAACGSEPAAPGAPSPPAAALDSGARLSAVCSGCHADGGEAIVSLDGQGSDLLRDKLNAYRIEADGTTVMHRIARGLTEAEITEIAAYLGNREAAQ